MKRRRLRAAAHVLALLLQAGLLAGAYELHVLSQTRMMVMRYFVAQNASLETTWFAPGAVLVQVGAFLVLAIAGVVATVLMLRRGSPFAAAQAATAVALAALGAWLASYGSADDMPAIYAVLVAVWLTLLVQVVVLGVSVRSAGARTIEEDH